MAACELCLIAVVPLVDSKDMCDIMILDQDTVFGSERGVGIRTVSQLPVEQATWGTPTNQNHPPQFEFEVEFGLHKCRLDGREGDERTGRAASSVTPMSVRVADQRQENDVKEKGEERRR
ncbi:hypothetical protein F4803DRAFT_328401 [Xylaria telfairii]|nr:hypothetical protein F4803DRAFT_328401 [Xylaria telfairii]